MLNRTVRLVAPIATLVVSIGILGCSFNTQTAQPTQKATAVVKPNEPASASTVASTSPKPIVSAFSTAGVQCKYVQTGFNSSASVNEASTSSWTCTESRRILTANGLPNHEAGAFPNAGNPHAIKAQQVEVSFPLVANLTDTATNMGGPRGAIGYVLNGVKIDAGTNGGCNDSGSDCNQGSPAGQWRMEALGQTSFKFGVDSSNAHVQPSGSYHYHGMPEGFIAKLGKRQGMALIGWAADGFPIYARYGFVTVNDASSSLKIIKASYRLKSSPNQNRPPVSVYAMGTFEQDYEYVAGLGDLDECNGRIGVTPEFPQGIYHYYATDSYPYLQRCVKGVVANSGTRPTRPR